MNADVVVIGGGTVGAAIGYGLRKHNLRVLLLDGNDRDFRAATANFGLVWAHGKGMGMSAYQMLTRTSLDLWPDFCAELTDTTGIDLQYERNGGLWLCQGEADFAQRQKTLLRLQNQSGGAESDWEMIDRAALERLLPRVRLGREVAGASLGRRDGHSNPLRLLAALHAAIMLRGGQFRGGVTVGSIKNERGRGFTIRFGQEQVSAARIVIAAGLGSKPLAAQVGLDLPIRPQRGQILVTERLEPFLPLPMSGLRQTREGTVMIGVTQEEAGFDTSTTSDAAAAMSAHAIRRIPALSEVKVVRHWAALRIMTPDGFPVYAESETNPGAFVATCHSGVTLAAAHAELFAGFIAAGTLPPSFNAFHHRRFHVPQAA